MQICEGEAIRCNLCNITDTLDACALHVWLVSCQPALDCKLYQDEPICLGIIVCLHNFLGGVDEEWFRLIHVAIEVQAAPCVAAIPAAQVVAC